MNIRSITATRRSARGGRAHRFLWGRGFTLIELMIVVAIVAILARLAYPAYTNSIIKGKRAQGRAALLDLVTQQERYFTQSNSYLSFNNVLSPTASNAANTPVTPFPFKNYSGDNPSAAAYLLGSRTCDAGPPASLTSCVEVFARPQFADPLITELTIRSTGAKGCTVVSGATSVCWS